MNEEKFNIPASDNTDVTLSDKKAAKKAAKKRKKFEKKELKRLKKEHARRAAVLPESKRPIICPPDCSDAANKKVVIGMILRALIIFFAVVGLSLFVFEAFGFDMTPGYLASKNVENYAGIPAGLSIGFFMIWSFLFVGLFSLSCLWRYGKFIAIPAAAAIAVIFTLPNPVRYLYEMALTLYNGALGHMKYMGFYAIDLKQVSVNVTMGSREELVRTAGVLFVLVISAVFVPSLIKRVRIVAPAVISSVIMIFIFVYNLSRSNWAVALIIASFTALIVLFVFDKIYIAKPRAGETDSSDNIFGEVDEPELNDRLKSKKSAKEEKAEKKKARREEKRARKKGKKITVDQEISEYFADSAPKKEKKVKVKLTPEEKKAAALARKEEKERIRAEKREDRDSLARLRNHRAGILVRRASIGGFAGAGIFLLSFVLLAIPAMSTKGSFETIPAIDDKLDYYREYITALLMGDDPALDLLAFEGDKSHFSPRDTLATPRYYTYEPIMTVESNYYSNVYLRGWIGTDYVDGTWTTADPKSETLEKYRKLFSTNGDASEALYYNFFKVMTDDGLPPEENDMTTSLKRLEKYGYIFAQVNMKRTEDFDDTILYMPSFHVRNYSISSKSSTGTPATFLRAYGSAEAGSISYANYFDGLYTSYGASKNGTDGYASVAMIPSMKYENLEYNLANLIAEFHQVRAGVANGKKTVEKNKEDDRLGVFSVTLYNGNVIEYTVESIDEEGTKILKIKQPVGIAVYTIKANGTYTREMIEVPEEYDEEGNLIEYYAPVLDTTVKYFELWDDTARWYFNHQITMIDKYTPYVYETYTKKSGSQIIKDLYEEIVANAVVEQDYGEPIPADFSLAANHSEYKYNKNKETYKFVSAVTDRDVYVQRHQLVMEIIDYLCDEEKYKYTLYPTVPDRETNTLDGVETFLTLTHEGYCVQYASSLVLLLREAGIPARYVDGYIATGFRNNREDDAVSRYVTTVRDSNAHAWVEVWFDGIGWVQYEATPEYYESMYVSATNTPTRPGGSTGTDSPEEEPEEEPEDTLTDYEIEQMLEAQRKERIRQIIKKIIIYGSIAIVVVTAIAIFFSIVVKRAKKSAKERAELLSEIINADEKEGRIPEREKVRRLGEMILSMLRECGMTPAPGEFREEFSRRIAGEYWRELAVAAPEEGLSEFETSRHPMREKELARVFDTMAAEEFGNGARTDDVPYLARLYYRLKNTVYRRKVSPMRRAVLYLVKRES